MPRKTGSNYFNEKHQALVCQWVSATTQQEYTRIYTALKPAVNHLVSQVMQRYFSVSAARYKEVLEDCVTNIFLHLHKYQPERQLAFTYIGTCARNTIYEMVVRIPATVKTIHPEYTDEEDTLDRSEVGIEYDSPREIDFKRVLKHFDTAQAEYQDKLNRLIKRHDSAKKLTNLEEYTYRQNVKKYKNYITVCKLCREFISKHESVNLYLMAEYVFLNTDFKRSGVKYLFQKMFKISVVLTRDLKEGVDDKKGYTMYNDDYTPIESLHANRQKKQKREKENDGIIYQYF